MHIKTRSRNRCWGKAISISYSECVFVALVIQHAIHMRHIILSTGVCLAVPYFSTLSHKKARFSGKKVTEPKTCVLLFSTVFVSNISHTKKNWARITIVHLQEQYPLFSPDLNFLAPKSIPDAVWGRPGLKLRNLNSVRTLTKESKNIGQKLQQVRARTAVIGWRIFCVVWESNPAPWTKDMRRSAQKG